MSSSSSSSSSSAASSALLAELRAKSVVEVTANGNNLSLRSWISTARKTLELAEKADSGGDLAAAYVGYRKTAG